MLQKKKELSESECSSSHQEYSSSSCDSHEIVDIQALSDNIQQLDGESDATYNIYGSKGTFSDTTSIQTSDNQVQTRLLLRALELQKSNQNIEMTG